jgi:hypothetical protein
MRSAIFAARKRGEELFRALRALAGPSSFQAADTAT